MLITVLILQLILVLLIIFWQLSLLIATILGSPIVWANPAAVDDCLILAEAKKGDLVVDLGCGNARTLIHMARRSGIKGIGIDRSIFCYLRARMNVFLSGQSKNIKIIFGDFKKGEEYLKKADIVYLYLLDQTLQLIEPWLFASIGEKTKVVSLCFKFKDHKPIGEMPTRTLHQDTKARLYSK